MPTYVWATFGATNTAPSRMIVGMFVVYAIQSTSLHLVVYGMEILLRNALTHKVVVTKLCMRHNT